MTTYSELRVRIDRGVARGSYRIVATGPAGEALGRFKLPFSEIELENFILKVGSTRRGRRRIESPEMELAKDFGTKLFGALFEGDVRELYRSSFAESRSNGYGLRVTLSLTGAPELLQVPWEYLYDHPSFLSISTWTPIVRYLDLPKPRRPLRIDLPLRVLGLVSAPTDAEPIDAQQERTKLEGAVAPLIGMGAIEIDWLDEASLRALQRQLRKRDYHVFHYIGHGGYDQDADDGVLLFEDEYGRGRRISGVQLGTILADEVSLRLAVLNSCEGGRSSLQDPFSGVATSLIEREIPAVIGMQFEITDRAAIVFAGEFYSALADGLPVDSSVAEARKAIYADENDVEWGTPVLFMRVADGRLFDVQPHAPIRPDSDQRVEPMDIPAADAEVASQEAERRREAEEAAEQERVAAIAEAERIEAERIEAERLEVERAEAKRIETERVEAEQAEADRVEQESFRHRAQEAPVDRAAEPWVSEEDLVAPQVADGWKPTEVAVGASDSRLAAFIGVPSADTTPPSRPQPDGTTAWEMPPGLPRALGRAAIGGFLGAAFSAALFVAINEMGPESAMDAFIRYAALYVVVTLVILALVEIRLPALRIPDGTAYRLVGGSRWAAIAAQGAFLGATIGMVSAIIATSAYNLTVETVLVSAFSGGMAFMIAEAALDRLSRRT